MPDPSSDETKDVDELSSTLQALDNAPNNVPLIQQQLNLMNRLDLPTRDTILHLASMIMLQEGQWLHYIESCVQQPMTLETFVDTLEQFERAEQDYISLPILLKHVEFIVAAAHTSDFELLTADGIRDMVKGVVNKGQGFLSAVDSLWQPWLEWERTLPEPKLHELYLFLASIPHIAIEETSSAYSSFCSETCPTEYEARMVNFTAATQKAKAKLSERRFGKTREDLEEMIAADFSAYTTYIDWEMDQRTKFSDPVLRRAIFERAIAAYAAAADANEAYREAYKSAEADIWLRYVALDEANLARGVRACPNSGLLWAALVLARERSGEDGVYGTALNMGVLTSAVDVAEVTVAELSRLRRAGQPVLPVATGAFDIIASLDDHGDPTLKIEKFLLECAESSPEEMERVISLIGKPLKARFSTYQMTLLLAAVQSRRGDIKAARKTYVAALHRSDLDWPEMVYEAFNRFELVHGTTDTIVETQGLIGVEKVKLAKRRAKQQQQHQIPEQEAVLVENASPIVAQAANKEVPDKVETQHKRDREHTTVLITGLDNVQKADLESSFAEHGHVREVTYPVEGDKSAALVEFRFADAVAAALARDGRKFAGQTIRVTMLWRSTLFVTNFSRETDVAALKSMFEQYGKVLSIRLPARKFSDSRRFCYVTMASPAAAQEALVLNGMKNGDFPLTVLISDPSVRAKRSDADSSTQRSLFVGGLTPDTREEDLKTLFSDVSHVKLGFDPVKRICKGFAFLEMANDDAMQAALALNGKTLNKKFLKVERSDPNHKRSDRVKADARLRSVRLHNLPEGTQEGLLQQELEKIAPVKRLEIFAKTQQAVAELESASAVGVLLLKKDPFVFRGVTIDITEHDKKGIAPPKGDGSKAAALVPRAARRGGKAIGRARPVTTTAVGGADQSTFRDWVKRKAAEEPEQAVKRAKKDERSE